MRDDSAEAKAIAEYLKDGGKIKKVQAAVPATVQEIIDYLATCGVEVKYFRGDPKPYSLNNERLTLTGLVRLANEYRRARRLPPMMVRN